MLEGGRGGVMSGCGKCGYGVFRKHELSAPEAPLEQQYLSNYFEGMARICQVQWFVTATRIAGGSGVCGMVGVCGTNLKTHSWLTDLVLSFREWLIFYRGVRHRMNLEVADQECVAVQL